VQTRDKRTQEHKTVDWPLDKIKANCQLLQLRTSTSS
jgi:hypothetical protein